jgi:hypothetical protein
MLYGDPSVTNLSTFLLSGVVSFENAVIVPIIIIVAAIVFFLVQLSHDVIDTRNQMLLFCNVLL